MMTRRFAAAKLARVMLSREDPGSIWRTYSDPCFRIPVFATPCFRGLRRGDETFLLFRLDFVPVGRGEPRQAEDRRTREPFVALPKNALRPNF